MKRRTVILLTCLAVVAVAATVSMSGGWLGRRASRSSSAKSVHAAAQRGPGMKCKLKFPQFFISVNGLASWIREPGAPVCEGAVSFTGDWPTNLPSSNGSDSIRITAQYETCWNGFLLGYELTADAPVALH